MQLLYIGYPSKKFVEQLDQSLGSSSTSHEKVIIKSLSDDAQITLLFIKKKDEILQMVQVRSDNSCFIGNFCNACINQKSSLESNMVILQHVDQLFLFLHCVQKFQLCETCIQHDKSIVYEDLFEPKNGENSNKILTILKQSLVLKKQLQHFCEITKYDQEDYYKFKWTLAYKWLFKKFTLLSNFEQISSKTLNQQNFNINYEIRTSLQQSLDRKLERLNLFSQYISKLHIDQFKQQHDINTQLQHQVLSQKQDDLPLEISVIKKKLSQPGISQKDKDLGKAAKISQSINNFFAKK